LSGRRGSGVGGGTIVEVRTVVYAGSSAAAPHLLFRFADWTMVRPFELSTELISGDSLVAAVRLPIRPKVVQERDPDR
jgi:hypothetical protein